MDMLGVKKSLDRMAKASIIRWYSLVLRKEDENVIVKALKFEVSGSRWKRRPKQTWKKQVEGEMKKNGLRSNKMARHGKDNNHTKSGLLRQRGQYRIQHVIWWWCDNLYKTVFY